MVMLGAALVAILIENIPALPNLMSFWESFDLGFELGEDIFEMSAGHLVNDFLMALFFLMVGLEIKYEMVAGELKNPRKALLPIVAAFGGVAVPALIFTVFNQGTGFEKGWGVPTATDIAFCLGVIALLGNRIPLGLRTFLAAVAIVDDIIAIVVIAVFYTSKFEILWLLGGLALFALLILINRRHIYSLPTYLVIGLAMWACFLLSGVHATLAGVLLAMTIPAKSEVQMQKVSAWFKDKAQNAEDRYDPTQPDIAQMEYLREVGLINRVSKMCIPPAKRLEYILHVPVLFFILPLFAFSNAVITVVGIDFLGIATNSVVLGVFFGLVVGKPIGIFCASWLVVKLKLSELPQGVSWKHIAGVAVLGGIGFTMVIFIANLAFVDPLVIGYAKTAILSASLLSGVTGFTILWWITRAKSSEVESYSMEGSATEGLDGTGLYGTALDGTGPGTAGPDSLGSDGKGAEGEDVDAVHLLEEAFEDVAKAIAEAAASEADSSATKKTL